MLRLTLAAVAATVATLVVLAVPGQTARATVAAPVVAVIGDSYTAGWGTACGCQSGAWFQTTAHDLGWTVGAVVADPAGGYVAASAAFGTFAQALSAHPIPATTNYVLIEGGLVDSNADPATIPGAVANLLAIIKRQAPTAVPIVVGAFDPIPGEFYGNNQVQVARAIGDYRGIGGNRYMIGFMCSFDVTPDNVHPTPAGHGQIGDWVAWHIAHGLDNGTPLHLDPTGTFYTV